MDEKKWIVDGGFHKCDDTRFTISCGPVKIDENTIRFALQVLFPKNLEKNQVTNILQCVQEVIEENVQINNIIIN